MQAQELRIGNWVEFRHTETPVRITLGDFVREYNDEHLEDYEPIPLTEEWLVKFGFENSWLWEHKDVYFNLLAIGDVYYYTADDHHHTSEAIRYVHQLQNLYYAITGEELNIKE